MRPSPELIRRLLLPVLDALAYAHQHNVVHGGISPTNLIITADTQTVVVTDWATADPQAPHHFSVYKGEASVLNDVKAVARVLSAYLPATGAFANPQVRGRIEGVINRCDTLADLRVTLETLEKLAASPAQKAARVTDFDLDEKPAAQKKTPDNARASDRKTLRDFDAPQTEKPKPKLAGPSLFCEPTQKEAAQVALGGGGVAALAVRNDGDAPLVIRMIATQHAWMNVRPLELPLSLPPGASVRVEFVISAARLSPGAYRSEIYFSANAGGQNAQDLREGWFKHTCDIRVLVVETLPVASPEGGAGAAPGLPANAPRLPAAPIGCGASVLLFPFVFLAGLVRATFCAFIA